MKKLLPLIAACAIAAPQVQSAPEPPVVMTDDDQPEVSPDDDPIAGGNDDIPILGVPEHTSALEEMVEEIALAIISEARLTGQLDEEDFQQVAEQLGVDAAAIHAVVDIEAGHLHAGFWDESHPVVYFSTDLFRRALQKRGISATQAAKDYPEVFAKPNIAKYRSAQAAQTAKLEQAMAIDADAAIESAYWGMFQIGGFNWRLCGTSSPEDFANKMQASERSQLNLFVNFLRNTHLDEPLRAHNWRQFARGYNGPSYAKRGYHTRLASAYKKYA